MLAGGVKSLDARAPVSTPLFYGHASIIVKQIGNKSIIVNPRFNYLSPKEVVVKTYPEFAIEDIDEEQEDDGEQMAFQHHALNAVFYCGNYLDKLSQISLRYHADCLAQRKQPDLFILFHSWKFHLA